jgi:hypothetical protein
MNNSRDEATKRRREIDQAIIDARWRADTERMKLQAMIDKERLIEDARRRANDCVRFCSLVTKK